jgi:CBS domain-containing protein
MKIRDILGGKALTVITVDPDMPIQEAVRLLVRHNIGSVVVHDGELRGILTERDLLRSVADDLPRLASGCVRDLMTSKVITAAPDAEILEVMNIMTENRIRHLPILDNGTLCGMISIGDVVHALRRSVEAENEFLHAYIHGNA